MAKTPAQLRAQAAAVRNLTESSAPASIEYTPTPKQRDFIKSEKFLNVLCGPRGEGKTLGGLFGAIYHAVRPANRSRWPLNWALVRDTRRNIGITTARTIQEWFSPPHIHLRGKPDEPEVITLFIGGDAALTFDCFGIDSASDLSRFQSYEASGGVWIEEPAPAATNAETLSSGIAEVVLAMAITSCRGSLAPRIQLTMNPPPADHWTAQLFRFPGFDEAGDFELEMAPEQREARRNLRDLSAVFFIRPGENVALDAKTPGYREKNRMALLAFGRRDLFARLVEGRVGYAKIGEAVTPQFTANHITPTSPFPRLPLYIAWDFGLQPAALIAQISPQGLLCIHAAYGLENQGVEQLITRLLRPWLLAHPDLSTSQIMHIGGPEGRMREQSNSEQTAVRTIITELGGRYIAGPVSWAARRDAIYEALLKSVNATTPWIRISPTEAAPLIRALDGAWHYPVDPSGRISRDLPDKRGLPPSFGDAFAHLCAVLLRRSPRRAQPYDLSEFAQPDLRDPGPWSGAGSGYTERPHPLPTTQSYARFGHRHRTSSSLPTSRTGV